MIKVQSDVLTLNTENKRMKRKREKQHNAAKN